MRPALRAVTVVLLAVFLCMLPGIALAEAEEEPAASEEQTETQTDAQAATDTTDTKKEETPPPPPPPKTYTLHYDPNGGDGEMDDSVYTEGSGAPLSRCTFTRAGYSFEGWNTSPDGGGTHLADGVDATDVLADGGVTLYAQWGSQIYLIRYLSGTNTTSSSSATGSMREQLAVHDAEVALPDCEFDRPGYTAKGWIDSEGAFHEFGELGSNFADGTSTSSWELVHVDVTKVRPETDKSWSCQGSVVFHGENDATYAAVAFINYDRVYSSGSLDNYDSCVVVVNVESGEIVKSGSGIMLEHANDIAYRPDNGHFYIAQGGLHDGFPNGIVELDEDLKEVRTVTPEGTHHIWNITYHDGKFYAIGNVDGDSFARGNPQGEPSDLIVLDKDLNPLETHTIDYSLQGFSGQGIACDGSYLYSVLISFGEHDSSSKQRLSFFTLDGEPRGTQRIDVTHEVESASFLDGDLYLSTNQGSQSTIYGSHLASVTMTAVWEPNAYEVTFDDGGHQAQAMPEGIRTKYDEPIELPSEEPLCPGYSFEGWDTQADGQGTRYQAGETVQNLAESGKVTLYAQWRRNKIALVGDNGKRVRGRRFRASGKRVRRQADANARTPRHASRIAAVAIVSVGGQLVVVWSEKRRAAGRTAIAMA